MTGTSELAAGVREGDVIAGKYRIEKVLGVGGMGVVVAAQHVHLDEKVALKFLLSHALANEEAVGRFMREAQAAVKIKSEHVAAVKDVGTLENGAPYMVMEYLEGIDLSAWLQQNGPMPIAQAVEFVLQACVAVADAHALGIVHRDLKPANLFCVRRSDGQLSIKVLDFGISKMTAFGNSAAMAMTKTAAIMGSPMYMSPEQIYSAKRVDHRTDIWALGVVLFELVTGRSPFLGDSLMELAIKIANDPPPPLNQYRQDVPPGFEAALHLCIEKDVARRYQHVGQMAAALLPFGPPRAQTSVDRITGIQAWGGGKPSVMPAPDAPSSPSYAPGPPTSPTNPPHSVRPPSPTNSTHGGHAISGSTLQPVGAQTGPSLTSSGVPTANGGKAPLVGALVLAAIALVVGGGFLSLKLVGPREAAPSTAVATLPTSPTAPTVPTGAPIATSATSATGLVEPPKPVPSAASVTPPPAVSPAVSPAVLPPGTPPVAAPVTPAKTPTARPPAPAKTATSAPPAPPVQTAPTAPPAPTCAFVTWDKDGNKIFHQECAH